MDALALRADERRDKLRKAAGRSKYLMSRGYLNGETHMERLHVSISKSIAYGGEPGELKHLSSRRKRKKNISERKIDFPSSGERTGKSPNQSACVLGFGLHTLHMRTGERHWKDRQKRVKAPYLKSECGQQDPEYHGTRETLWE